MIGIGRRQGDDERAKARAVAGNEENVGPPLASREGRAAAPPHADADTSRDPPVGPPLQEGGGGEASGIAREAAAVADHAPRPSRRRGGLLALLSRGARPAWDDADAPEAGDLPGPFQGVNGHGRTRRGPGDAAGRRGLAGRRAAKLAPAVEQDPERPLLEEPGVPPTCKLVNERWAVERLCKTRLLWDEADGIHRYEVLEPQLEDFERDVLAFLAEALRRSLTLLSEDATEAEAQHILTGRVDELIEEHLIRIDDASRTRILYYLHRDFAGYGRIDPFMRDPDLEDVSCDGPDVPVFLFHRRLEAMRSNVTFRSASELDSFVLLLAQKAGKHISVAQPLLDATLPDRSRLQATYGSEITTRGSSFTIRRFRAEPITPPMLLDFGTSSPEMMAFFWLAIEHGQSTLVVGGTASGKTTTLNACSLFIPSEKKIVSIEDTREINLPHENWIAGLTRSGGGELVGDKSAGEVSMYDLLASALRQRPEYLLVGEVRGPEAMTLFQAMATGHATYSTMHADSVPGAIHRLEHEPILVPRVMLENLRVILIQAQVRVGDRLARRVKEVVEIRGLDLGSGEIVTNAVFRWVPGQDRFERSPRSYVVDRVAETLQLTPEQVWAEVDRRAEVLAWMQRHRVADFRQVAEVVRRYRHDPEEVLTRVRRSESPGQPGWLRSALQSPAGRPRLPGGGDGDGDRDRDRAGSGSGGDGPDEGQGADHGNGHGHAPGEGGEGAEAGDRTAVDGTGRAAAAGSGAEGGGAA